MCGKVSPYAVSEKTSRGRSFPEKPHPYRSDFERDRDRIIHCAAFRRLEGKTQVFTPGLDDFYRTRLTHSVEVAQIGRTISQALALNDTLTEAICLAHDLGHSPFGHAGESVLDNLMRDFGGFEHNRQALRIVDLLEHPYPDFSGLNLMFETRLGLAKHRSPYDTPRDRTFPQPNCTLEGQTAGAADRIAVGSHDLEDAMRAGLIRPEQLKSVQLLTEAQERVHADAIDDGAIRSTRTAKAIIDTLVSDCITASARQITRANVGSPDQVCTRSDNLIVLGEQSERQLLALEQFLLENFYRHPSLLAVAADVETWLTQLFDRLCKNPQLMPNYFRHFIDRQGLQRTVCDYIAGMTDRFCLKMLKEI